VEGFFIFCLQCVSAMFLVIGTVYASWKITWILLPDETASVKWCGICAVALWIAAFGFHVLAWTAFFTIGAAVLAVGFGVAICHFLIRSPRGFLEDLAGDFREMRSACNNRELINPVIIRVFAFFAVLVLARDLVLPPLAWDTLTYHATKAGMWVQSGSIWLMNAPGGWSYQRCFPGGGELFHAWAMLPFHADTLVSSVDWVQWLFLMIALYSLGICLGLSSRLSATASMFCGFLPSVVFSVGSCYVDILLALTFTLSAVFLVRFMVKIRPAYIFLECLALGVAGGVKLTAYPTMATLIILTLFYVLVKKQISRTILAAFAGGLLCMALTFVPWLLHNSFETGLPFSPLDIKFGNIMLGKPSQELIRLQETILEIVYSPATELQALLKLFRFPLSVETPDFGAISMAFVAFFPITIIGMARKNLWFAIVILALVASFIGTYAAPEFTAIRVLWAVSNARFLYTAFFLMTLSCLFLVSERRWERAAELLLCVPMIQFLVGIFHYWAPYEWRPLAVVLASMAILVGIIRLLSRLLSYQGLVAVLTAGLVAFFILLDSTRAEIRYHALGRSFFFHGFPYYWAPAVTLLDNAKHPHSIAVTSGVTPQEGFLWHIYRVPPWFLYMFMGSRLQNTIQYVPIEEKGDMLPLTPSSLRDIKLSYSLWLTRLRQKEITHVMSFFPESVELRWMKHNTDSFEPLFLGKEFGCFRVR